jgi:GNAT superfamily N-acetyltransferase
VRRASEGKAIVRVLPRGRNKRAYAEIDGKDVSRVYIVPRQVRMGPASEVHMAGIGGVGTNREFRGRGLARLVYERTMQEIKKDGYSCSGLLTGSVIVAHRLYHQFGYADVMLFPQPAKLLDPRALVVKGASRWAKRESLAEWSGTMTVRLEGHPAVHLRFESGEVKALSRAPKQVDLALTTSDVEFAGLSWGWMRPEYLMSSDQLAWEGRENVWQRLLRALWDDRPCVHGY